VVFGLCEDFVLHRISVVLDVSLGWHFHWQRLAAFAAYWLPVVLQCPRAVSWSASHIATPRIQQHTRLQIGSPATPTPRRSGISSSRSIGGTLT
jgi:hypothetical protein